LVKKVQQKNIKPAKSTQFERSARCSVQTYADNRRINLKLAKLCYLILLSNSQATSLIWSAHTVSLVCCDHPHTKFLSVPPHNLDTAARRISVAAPRLWNSLPLNCRNALSVIIIIERKDLGGVMSKDCKDTLQTLKTVTTRECDAKWEQSICQMRSWEELSRSGKLRMNSSVFNWRLKDASEDNDVRDPDKLFHVRATGKARSPAVERRVGGTTSVDVDEERRRYHI